MTTRLSLVPHTLFPAPCSLPSPMYCSRCGQSVTPPPGFMGGEVRCANCGQAKVLPPPLPTGTTGPSSVGGLGSVDDPLEEIYQPLARRKREEAEMDMTPMIDVVFLLLIFFMVTASFGLQKSIELPVPDQEQSAKEASTPKQPEDQDAEIVVNVTKDNRIFVEGEEAPTRQELYARLRDRQHQGGRTTNRMLVIAESQALHEFVVRAIDAGNVVGMESVRIQTTE